MNPEISLLLKGAVAIVIIFFTLALAIGLIKNVYSFRHELNYIKREIARSEGDQRKHWEKEKRRLWLSLLPFYRR